MIDEHAACLSQVARLNVSNCQMSSRGPGAILRPMFVNIVSLKNNIVSL